MTPTALAKFLGEVKERNKDIQFSWARLDIPCLIAICERQAEALSRALNDVQWARTQDRGTNHYNCLAKAVERMQQALAGCEQIAEGGK